MMDPGRLGDLRGDSPSAFDGDRAGLHTLAIMSRRGGAYLRKHGIPNATNNAEWLLCDAMECGRLDLLVRSREIPPVDRARKYWDNILRRARREPLQYILGTTEFMSMPFYTPRGVFVPRPDTEVLVEFAETRLRQKPLDRKLHILDLCTGSGVIAVALAARIPNLTALAVDASDAAVRAASMNAELNGVQGRVEVASYDALSLLDTRRAPSTSQPRPTPYTAIVCNPPYIETNKMAELPPEVRDHEPFQALDGGADGLEFYRAVLPVIPFRLEPGGFAAFEIGDSQGAAVGGLMERAGLRDITVAPDYAGRDRVVSGVKPA